MAKTSPVQSLYELCKRTFTSPYSGVFPSPHSIRALSSLLDTIKPTDVGLGDDSQEDSRGHGFLGGALFSNFQSSRAAQWAQPITYLHLYENDNFTIGIFCFPTSSVIPLHDHPGMTVMSKILYGSMHVKAYDWIEPARLQQNGGSENSPVRLAKLHTDTVLTAPCPTSVLYPKTGGNLHCFTAITPCAMLDVLAPPYCDAAGRTCSYYNDYPYSTFKNKDEVKCQEDADDYAWLERIESPVDFSIRSGRYSGPTIHV